MIRFLEPSDLDALRRLANVASAEGFGLLDRLVGKVEAGSVLFDDPRQFFLCVVEGGEIIGVGGVTPDPYVSDSRVGRLRHVYIHPNRRRLGLGAALVQELVRIAAAAYPTLRLRAETKGAGALYESLSFKQILDDSATHARVLASA
jgi:GNAT superfamily N-acetyltransferase